MREEPGVKEGDQKRVHSRSLVTEEEPRGG